MVNVKRARQSRHSTWRRSDKKFNAGRSSPGALKYSAPDWRPIIPVWDKINVQALGVGISEALTGKKTAEAALNDLVAPVTQIMREAGYKV
jgi:ABC-type glycerol-3-phosphate transport system substrate-binding protein